MNDRDPIGYTITEADLAELFAIAGRLQGGTMHERDEGHRMWLICCAARDFGGAIEAEELGKLARLALRLQGGAREQEREAGHRTAALVSATEATPIYA